jgi:hypothetical protein
MSQHEKGSSHQLLSVIERDPKIIFNIVEEGLCSYGVRFNEVEHYRPNQVNKSESTIENFVKALSTEFPKADLKSLYHWWAVVGQKPSWDFISTCNIDGVKGILLVEAKSHSQEIKADGKTITVEFSDSNADIEKIRQVLVERYNSRSLTIKVYAKELKQLLGILSRNSLLDEKLLMSCLEKLRNHDKIGNAISEARGALSNFCSNISISRDTHYQLSNRIAYTWKLATVGIPTILLYLGFINDPAWMPQNDHFRTKHDWLEAIQCYFAEVGANELLAKKKVTLANGVSMHFLADIIDLETQKHIEDK